MNSTQRTAWFLIVGLVLAMVVLAFEAPASTASVGRALRALPVYVEDKGDPRKAEQLDAIAQAVAKLRPPAVVLPAVCACGCPTLYAAGLCGDCFAVAAERRAS